MKCHSFLCTVCNIPAGRRKVPGPHKPSILNNRRGLSIRAPEVGSAARWSRARPSVALGPGAEPPLLLFGPTPPPTSRGEKSSGAGESRTGRRGPAGAWERLRTGIAPPAPRRAPVGRKEGTQGGEPIRSRRAGASGTPRCPGSHIHTRTHSHAHTQPRPAGWGCDKSSALEE